MRRDARQQSGSGMLETVREGFARFRRERRGSRDRFPDEVRRLALAAVEAGLPRGQVADAAGIERSALGRWQLELQGDKRPTGVRELRIVKGREDQQAPADTAASGVAVVRIGRQVAIELPVASLTASFLRTLVASNGGAP